MVFLQGLAAQAAELHVPADHATLAEAIARAAPGDIVLIDAQAAART